MRPLSQTLTDLIGFAEEVVIRPLRANHMLLAGPFARLAEEVRQAVARPAESVRTTDAAMVMVIAIEAYLGAERDANSPWLMLIGMALPMLRDEAWVAIRNEKEARGS